MYPYQVYKVLADQHIRDLTADARSHGPIRATQRSVTDPMDGLSRLRDAIAHLAALVHVARRDVATSARATSTAPSTRVSSPAAGPLGCSA